MKKASSRKVNRLKLLVECHEQINDLLGFLFELSTPLEQTEPAWVKVQELFTRYGAVRTWVDEHPDAIRLYDGLRPDAIEWLGRAFASWHDALAQTFIADEGGWQMLVWLVGQSDEPLERCRVPDVVDWQKSDLGFQEEPPTLRADTWRHMRAFAVTPAPRELQNIPVRAMQYMNGWCALTSIKWWELPGRLKAEKDFALQHMGGKRAAPQTDAYSSKHETPVTKKRGRPKLVEDKIMKGENQLYENWKISGLTQSEFLRECGIEKKEGQRMLDRARKRLT